MEFHFVLLLHALSAVVTVGVVWMSYAFAAIEDAIERRADVFRILVGVLTTLTFLGCGTALIWLCETDRPAMAWALVMLLGMVILMHVMVSFAQRVIGTGASKLTLSSLFGSFTIVVYCILSLIIFSNSDLAMFGVARDLKRSVTGHLPIDGWPEKKVRVLKVMGDALAEQYHAFQYAAKRLDHLSDRPEVKDVLLIVKDAAAVLDDYDARVAMVADAASIISEGIAISASTAGAPADIEATALADSDAPVTASEEIVMVGGDETLVPLLPAVAEDDDDDAPVASTKPVAPVLPVKASRAITPVGTLL